MRADTLTQEIERWLAQPLPSSSEMDRVIAQVAGGESLSIEQSVGAARYLMSGQAAQVQIASLLAALHQKGETVEEMAGFAFAMRAVAERIRPAVKGPLADTCGTGGDSSKSINVSTASALVLAAAGVPVAKHGNRALTSSCGSADVLEAMGVRVDLAPAQVQSCIEQAGIGFLFAPKFHLATKHVQPVRRQLPHKTIFNALGPLTNPAPLEVQLVGVYEESLLEPMARVLRLLGRRRAMVVCGRLEQRDASLDECSLSGPTEAILLDASGTLTRKSFTPEDAGLERAAPEQLVGGEASVNARILEGIIRGEEEGPRRQYVELNAAAALWTAEAVPDLKAGVKKAGELLDRGAVRDTLDRLIKVSQALA